MIDLPRSLAASIACGVCAWAAITAQAAYPERPVRIIVGFTPGSGGDSMARLIADKLREKWSQPVIVENRVGASNTIAMGFAARAAPDGYTLAMVNANFTVTPSQMKLDYDPVHAFTSISLLATQPDLLVILPSLPAKSVKALIAHARANPGKLNFGSSGTNGAPYLAMALLMQRTAMRMVNVNYRGTAEASLGLLGGEVQLLFGSITSVFPAVESRKVLPLAVSSKRRFAGLPDLPTVAEAADLPGFDVNAWQGVLAPAGLPKGLAGRIHADAVAAMKAPDVQARLARQGNVTIASTPDEFAAFIENDIPKWAAVLKTINPQ